MARNNNGYTNTNKGAVWEQLDKDTENHPDFRGRIDVEGVERWLSGWWVDGESEKAPTIRFSVGDVIDDNSGSGSSGGDSRGGSGGRGRGRGRGGRGRGGRNNS